MQCTVLIKNGHGQKLFSCFFEILLMAKPKAFIVHSPLFKCKNSKIHSLTPLRRVFPNGLVPLLLLAGHFAPNVLHGLFNALFILRRVLLLLILLVGHLLLLALLGGNGLLLVLASPVVCEQFVHLNRTMFGKNERKGCGEGKESHTDDSAFMTDLTLTFNLPSHSWCPFARPILPSAPDSGKGNSRAVAAIAGIAVSGVPPLHGWSTPLPSSSHGQRHSQPTLGNIAVAPSSHHCIP